MFRDPSYEIDIPAEEFIDVYRPLLETLDGSDMCSYIDCFFRPSPVNNTIYEFTDEDARLDFRDLAEEMNLIPKLQELVEGEDFADKNARKAKELEKEIKRYATKQRGPVKPDTNKLLQEIEKMKILISIETDPIKLEKLRRKLAAATNRV